MDLSERVYSVLLVSAAENLNNALMALMPASRFDAAPPAPSISAAQRILAERSFDIVIINSPLPDDAGIRFAIDTTDYSGTVTLLIVKAELHSDIYARVSRHGVFTMSKPVSRNMAETVMLWLVSARERLKKLEKKTGTLEEKMQEIRLVNRAKWLLISELNMDEQTAHRYIEKQAMDRCVSRRKIAEGIIDTYT